MGSPREYGLVTSEAHDLESATAITSRMCGTIIASTKPTMKKKRNNTGTRHDRYHTTVSVHVYAKKPQLCVRINNYHTSQALLTRSR